MGVIDRLTHRPGDPLPAERASARISAYVYGNLLILAAIASVGADSITGGAAILIVLGTTLSTYVAHIISESIAHRVTVTHESGTFVSHELRDAMPILSSGTIPILLLAAGSLGWLPTVVCLWAAAGVTVFRIAALGPVVHRLQDKPRSWRVALGGVLAAIACIAVVAIKLTFIGH